MLYPYISQLVVIQVQDLATGFVVVSEHEILKAGQELFHYYLLFELGSGSAQSLILLSSMLMKVGSVS